MSIKIHKINQKQLGQFPECITIRLSEKIDYQSKKIITNDSSGAFKFFTSKALIMYVHPHLSLYISQQRQNLSWSQFPFKTCT